MTTRFASHKFNKAGIHSHHCAIYMAYAKHVVLALLAMALLVAVTAKRGDAQGTTATILGTVTDSTGAVVPGATVAVKNTGTDVTQSVMTDAQGRYTVASLPVGNYQLQTTKTGFQKVVRPGITVTVGSQMVVDFTLPVGKAEETVEVQGAVQQVEITTSSISNLVDQRQMVELPLNGRNFAQLMTLAPGVAVAQTVTGNFYGKGDTYTVSGSRPEGQAYLLDGSDITNFFNHGTGSGVLGTSLGIDAIGEFQTLTNTYSAQFGGNGGVMNAVSKSGTNKFHGSAFEFIRNSALDARNFFDLKADGSAAPVPAFRRNQFGGTFGGPIKKDKAFFFFNYEGLRASLAQTITSPVPDANAHLGYLPCGAAPNTTCGPNGLANVGVAPNVAATLNLYPATTLTNSQSGIVRIPQVAPDSSNENYLLGRFDYVITPKDSFFARVVSDRAHYLNPFPYAHLALWPDNENSPNLFYAMEERHTFTSVVNSVRASFSRTENNARTGVSHPGAQFFPASENREDGEVQVAGLYNIGAQALDPFRTIQRKLSVYDDLIWTKGAHTIKLGAQFTEMFTFENGPYLEGGLFIFSSLENFLKGSPVGFLGAKPGQNMAVHWWREYQFMPYINDDWKVTSKLTVNLGLRYEYNTNPTCLSHDCYSLVHPYTDKDYSLVEHPFANNPAIRNFDPRIGFAFDPFADHKTSIRGGYGIFHDVIAPRQWTAMFVSHKPFGLSFQVAPTYPLAFSGFDVGLPSDIVATSYATDTTPYQQQWNLNIQREMFPDTIISLGYIGSHGTHLLVGRDGNPPYCATSYANELAGVLTNHCGSTNVYFGQMIPPFGIVTNPRINSNFGAYSVAAPDGSSTYHSLQINLTRRFSHNVEAQAAYTWSKCLSTADGTSGLESGGQPIENPWNQALDHGPCTFNTPHALRVNTVLALPFKGNKAVQGWQISAIVNATSGLPFSPLVGYDSAGLANNGSIYPMERANLKPGFTCGKGLTTGDPFHWFNTDAFSNPDVGLMGNAPRDCLRGPALFDTDFSISKETVVSEQFRIQFRAEFFNVFNHTNFMNPIIAGGGVDSPYNLLFGGPGATKAVPTAGQPTLTSTTSRQIQFGLKLLF